MSETRHPDALAMVNSFLAKDHKTPSLDIA